MVSSNFRLVVESRDRDHFVAAMKMCFDDFNTARGYRIDADGLHLFWMSPENADGLPLPYEMKVEQAIEFVWGWLQNADRGPEPDHDGSNSKDGFVVEHVSAGWTYAGWTYEFVRVRAVWSEYHK